MDYLTGKGPDQPADEQIRDFRDYLLYLDSIAALLPAAARDFALAPWHYMPSDPRCPHDAWVEAIAIRELSRGERHETRALEIHMRLLGACHDGHIELRYENVHCYSIDAAQGLIGGHGDWLIDEIALTADGAIAHTIEFINGMMRIECEDIHYAWLPRPAAEDEADAP
jgi:hypothetical protein